MPFSVPWTDADPVEMARYQWELRAGIRRDHWTLNFTVLLDGVPICTQSLGAFASPSTRTIEPRPGHPDELQEVRLLAAEFNRPSWDIAVERFDAVRQDLFVAALAS